MNKRPVFCGPLINSQEEGSNTSLPVALQQPGSELISMAPISTEGYADVWGLESQLRPCWCQRHVAAGAILSWVT